MGSQKLKQTVAARLADQGESPGVVAVVNEAFDVTSGLDEVSTDGFVDEQGTGEVYLASIEVEGFRGVGSPAAIEVAPVPGLTLVLGRNGSGKSTFAEGLEVLLTADSYRWAGSNRVWKDGFRNAHEPDPTRVSATFMIAGQQVPLSANRAWAADAKVDESNLQLAGYGIKQTTDLADLGWEHALEVYRPIMSHEELSAVIKGNKTEIFRKIADILGLGEVEAAADHIRQQRLATQKQIKEVNDRAKVLGQALGDLDWAIAQQAAGFLAKPWNLEGLQGLIDADAQRSDDGVAALRSIAGAELVDRETVSSSVQAVTQAKTTLDALAGSHAADAARTAKLLSQALEHQQVHGDEPCPVCQSSTLDASWRKATEDRVAELAALARGHDDAVASLRAAESKLRGLCSAAPSGFGEMAARLGSVDSALAAWRTWAELSKSPLDELLEQIEVTHGDLAATVTEAQTEAREQLAMMRAEWAPLERDLAAWLAEAQDSEGLETDLKGVKAAEEALKQVIGDLRIERFGPIKQRTMEIWELLRHESSVELEDLVLTGTHLRGDLKLAANIDGEAQEALAVMSQGELNCLSLSLFLPRATHPDSPFRFVVIDDPVQAMDPAKVDGLARVLEETAANHQVVVFTHDDRLAEAIQRLKIPATVLEVRRQAHSQVKVREISHPVEQYFLDARAVSLDKDLNPLVARKVIPGLCRTGLEAACTEAIRRRWIGAGASSHDVDNDLEAAKTLTKMMSLALFASPDQGGDVMRKINEIGRNFGDAYQACNKGVHQAYEGDLGRLINDAQGLAERVRRL